MSAEAAKSIVESIRKALHEGGQGGGNTLQEILLVPKDGKKLIRFLTEFDKALPIIMHDQFKVMYPQPCLRYYEEPCPFHGESGFRETTQYAFTVWDYESQSKRVAMWKATAAGPMEDLLYQFDKNSTITDRDWEIKRSGTGTKGTTRARSMDPAPFEGKLSQPFPEERVMEIVKGLIAARTLADLAGKIKEGE